MTEFRRMMVELAGRFRTVAYSRRYHPPNPGPSTGDRYAMSEQSGDLLGILGLVGPAHVVGISWGGYAALCAAVERSDLFRSLVLAEPPILPLLGRSDAGRRHLEAFLATAIGPAREAFRRGDGERGLALFMDGILGAAGAFDALPAGVRSVLLRYIPELALELTTPFDLYMPELSDGQIASVNRPVLLAQGSRSPAMFAAILDALSRHLPQSRRVVIPDAGHAMHLANPAAFTRTVAEFLCAANERLNDVL